MPEQTNRLPVAARREMDGVVWVRASDYSQALECIADLEAERDAQAAEIEWLEADLAHEKAEHAETVDDYQNACRLHEKAKVQLDALLEAAETVCEQAWDFLTAGVAAQLRDAITAAKATHTHGPGTEDYDCPVCEREDREEAGRG